MQTRLNAAGTIWRSSFAVFFVWFVAIPVFRDPKRTNADLVMAIAPATALIAMELLLRVFRKTLVVRPNQIDVMRCGTLLGSFDPKTVQFWSSTSRIRSLVRTFIQGCAATGLLVMIALGDGAGWLAFGVGLVAMAASYYDFQVSWNLQVPRPNGPWTLRLAKADAVKILGFWPGDPPPPAAKGTAM